MQNSIVSFEFQSKEEALAILDLYVEKAQCISFYSYTYNPYNNEFQAIYPTKQVTHYQVGFQGFLSSYRPFCDIYIREEDYFTFACYRSPVRNHRYFARK